MLNYYAREELMVREVQKNDLRNNDKKLGKYLEKYDAEVMYFIKNTLLYELAAFQVASAYNHDCIWSDSCLEQEYMEAMSFMTFQKPPFSAIDTKKIKSIIEEKYNLKSCAMIQLKLSK